ncbi:MAG: hypothetical protein JW725_04225 [Candidatus Babeliaceae bacterium]|nr:hypothetical protein [Candidatus Babeliaceae bacterium]
MNLKKRISGIILSMFCFVASAHARCWDFYAEGYVGVIGGHSQFPHLYTQNTYGSLGMNGVFRSGSWDKKIPAQVMGGIKMGLWFDCWQDYGCYLDFCAHRLNFKCCREMLDVAYTDTSVRPFRGPAYGRAETWFSSCGHALSFAVMFAYRIPDVVLPWFCRCVEPYLAVGPGLLFAKEQPCLVVNPHEATGGDLTVVTTEQKRITPKLRLTSTAPLFQAETGIRHFFNGYFSCELGFKYRYVPHRCLENGCLKSNEESLWFNPAFHLFSGQIGFAYHF